MNNTVRTTTSTQIRNMYSPGNSYINIKFFNTDLSFKFHPYIQNDVNGRSQYDDNNAQITTVNYEDAFLLYTTARDILDGKLIEGSVKIPCNNATLTLERKLNNGKPETVFSIDKNNITIPFIFKVCERKVKSNGQTIMTTWVEAGLGAFMKTLEGYLTGINAERHLNKLTDDFVNAQNQANNNMNNQNSYRGNNNGGYNKKPYNNFNKKSNYQGGYKQRYNNQNDNNPKIPWTNNTQNNNGPKPPWGNNTQSMSNYSIND